MWSLGRRQLAVCKEESVPNALDTLGISLIIWGSEKQKSWARTFAMGS